MSALPALLLSAWGAMIPVAPDSRPSREPIQQPAQQARSLLQDPDFRCGVQVFDPAAGRHVPRGILQPDRSLGRPAWRLVQWSSRSSLAGAAPQQIGGGAVRFADQTKAVIFGPPEGPQRGLTLALRGSAEYGDRPRRPDEPWPHLLVEQTFTAPPVLDELAELPFHISFRLNAPRGAAPPDPPSPIHAAQFLAYLVIQNLNIGSPGYGDCLWVGVQMYDSRYRFPPAHMALDPPSGKFIFNLPGKAFSERSAHDGEWITIDRDLLPIVHEGLAAARREGFLKQSPSDADFRVAGFNIGWELPGTPDVEMQIRDLRLSARAAEAAGDLPAATLHRRAWRCGGPTGQSLMAVGNGRMIAYLRGPDVAYLWGPPYFSPNLATMELTGPEGLEAVSSRMPGAAVWVHRLSLAGRHAGTITDFVDAELPGLVRIIDTSVPLALSVTAPGAQMLDTTPRYPERSAMLYTHPAGSPVYGYRFRTRRPMLVHILAEGAAGMVGPVAGQPARIEVAPGRATIFAVGGPEYPECMVQTEEALAAGPQAMLQRTLRWWRDELAGLRVPPAADIAGRSPATVAEDAAVNIITQQAAEGGVLAGHNYCLAYVFDQFGVARALNELGLIRRSRRNLEFYHRVWQRTGTLHQAQSIDDCPAFHVHENDEVQVTGYLILQAFEYLQASDDHAFLREIAPMLEWAFQAQQRHLAGDMLPFNGDETYIAGGIVPRSVLDDGCAEATWVFFTGGLRLADWAQSQGLWDAARADAARDLCRRVQAAFEGNFVVDGRLMVNNPARTAGLRRERFRHGVCQAGQEGCAFFGWLEAAPDGRYCCPMCFLRHRPDPFPPARHYLPSVALTPLFLDDRAVPGPAEHAQLQAALQAFRRADGTLDYPSGRLPGYELGVILAAMNRCGHPEASRVAELLCGLIDDTGSWVEYYEGAVPAGTRYRPWETAINCWALLRHAAQAGPR